MTETVPAAALPPAPAPRLAFGIGPDGTYTPAGQTAAFIFGLLTTFVFLPLMMAAALLYTRAETVFPDDPDRARTLVNWSWISITVPALIGAAALPLLLLFLI